MKKISYILFCLIFICSSALADSLEESFAKIQEKKKEMISKSIHLTEEQSKVFWEIYADYESELSSVTQEGFKLMQKYSEKYRSNSISVQDASNIMAGDFRAKAREIQIKEQYLPRYQAALPAEIVLRFYQLENKIDLLLGAEIAESLPLLEPDLNI